MWRLILLILLVSFSCSEGQEVVRVVSWNLKWFPGGTPNADEATRESHFREVTAEIVKLRADVLVLQEVRDEATMDRLLAHLPGFKTHVVSRFKEAFSGAVGQQQLAILSKFPAGSAWAEAWKKGWANAPRGYVFARLQLGETRVLNVYGLHLKSNLGDPVSNTAKREDAAEQLLSHIATQVGEDEPVIIGGDFNTSLDDPRFAGDSTLRKVLQAGFFWTFEGIPHSQRITVAGNGRYPDACFDHLFTRNLGRPVAQMFDVSGSDHRPVAVDVVVE